MTQRFSKKTKSFSKNPGFISKNQGEGIGVLRKTPSRFTLAQAVKGAWKDSFHPNHLACRGLVRGDGVKGENAKSVGAPIKGRKNHRYA
ncbi:MAG: hypothetical protein Q4F52_10185 [Bacteroidaceae bacterium]|nr:hypothetical protein [Bacteroidaceae bacterium]